MSMQSWPLMHWAALTAAAEFLASLAGESWMVHGGGFYRTEKYLNAPEALPKELHWFKYEAYFTWVTGFLLIAIIYYYGAETYLIDRAKADLVPWQAIAISVASPIC